jgi:hypothetical protein
VLKHYRPFCFKQTLFATPCANRNARISAVVSMAFVFAGIYPDRAAALDNLPPICAQSYQQLHSPNPETARRANKIYDVCGEAYMICALVGARNGGQTDQRDCIAKTVAGAVQSIDGNGAADSGSRETKAPAAPAAKPDIQSAKYFLPGCKQQVAGENNMSAKDAYTVGQCLGMVETLMVVGAALSPSFRICVPHTLTMNEAIRAVIKYLEAKPEELQQQFIFVADRALAQAWPCK